MGCLDQSWTAEDRVTSERSEIDRATLVFFRERPADPSDEVISSLQAFETALFLVALHRYPHALMTWVVGVENALKAKLPSSSRSPLQQLLNDVLAVSPLTQAIPTADLVQLRQFRNRVAHRGFSPRDDSESAALLLRVGIPLTQAVFADLHDFDFRNGLLEEYARLVDIGVQAYALARDLHEIDYAFALNPLGHLIRVSFQANFSTTWQLRALERGWEVGLEFEAIAKGRNELESLFGASAVVSCPICAAVDSLSCELDSEVLDSRKVVAQRAACVSCGFVVATGQPFITQLLVGDQLQAAREDILRGYGIR
jgi:hypothetical protein